MINTYSKFYYGFTVTSSNKYLDIEEPTGQITAILRVGHYTLETLCDEIQYQLNLLASVGYTVTANRTTRKITISCGSNIIILGATGTNAANGCYSLIGFNAVDTGSATSHESDFACGSVYLPQYKLQDYVASVDNRKLRQATVTMSASGKNEVISFGNDDMFEFSIKFITNIYQPSSGPIVNNKTGVEDFRTLMQYLINKYEVEFMPDKDTPSVFYRVVLESSPADSNGTGYKLEEQYGRGLTGYFESGILKFRVIEG